MATLRAHKAGVRSLHRRRVVGVIGSGVTADPCAADVGRMIASLGCDLLTGGGGGCMAAVSRAFVETPGRRGLVIGIVPGEAPGLESLEARSPDLVAPVEYDVRPAYPNRWVEVAIYTHLPDSGLEGTLRSSRNHLNVLSSDVIVALPGGEGTDAEMWLAVQYGVPIVALGDHACVPDGVRVAGDLDAVRAFVIDALESRSGRTRGSN